MPANPLHFSAIAPLHSLRPETFDITALLYSSILVDLELLYSFLIGKPMDHGIWHSYLFVTTIYPVILSLIVYIMERRFEKTIFDIYRFFRFFPSKVRYSPKTVYFSCLIGGISHIFIDMWTHENSAFVLFPIREGNPFWAGEWSVIVQGLVILLSVYTVFLWIKGARKARKRVKTGGDSTEGYFHVAALRHNLRTKYVGKAFLSFIGNHRARQNLTPKLNINRCRGLASLFFFYTLHNLNRMPRQAFLPRY